MPKRKISFNYLFLKVGDLEQPIEGALNKVLNYIISKDKVNRKQDVNNDKFAFLDSFDYDTTSQYHTMQLLFKSAKHQGRRIKLNFPSTAYLSSPHSIPLSVVLD